MKKEIIVGIYKITSPSGKIYIGQSWNIKKRFNTYNILDCKPQTKLYNSLKCHKPENHIFEKLEIFDENITQEFLDERELYWIKFYKSQNYEMLNIREGGKGSKISEETKKKMSESAKGRIVSEETRQKLRVARLKQKCPTLGRKMTDSLKEKLRQIAINKKGYKHTEETKRKMSEAKKGRPMSEKTRELLLIANLGRERTLEEEERQSKLSSKAIIQYDLHGKEIERFKNIAEAAIKTNTCRGTIINSAKGRTKIHKNFIWKYLN